VPTENSAKILPPRRFCQLTGGSGWLFHDSGALNGKTVENPWLRIKAEDNFHAME